MAGWSWTVHLTKLLPSVCQSLPWAFEIAKGNCFQTSVGKVGCGQSSTINRWALFVPDCKTPYFIVVCCYWCFKMSRTKIPDLIRGFFCFVFLLYSQLQTSHFTRLHGFRSCRPSLPEKKKVFIWCNGKETTTMCATFCSLERSSATKHFDWTLLSNPALQTVPFFLSKTKHKGITPKIARISGCSIKEYP